VTNDANGNALDDMGEALREQIFELWLRPELERRGLDKQPEEVVRTLVIFPPGQRPKPRVLIDTEVKIEVSAKATRPIRAGEQVTEADIEAIEALVPQDLDPDAGWIGFVVFKGVYFIEFDFRRNRARAAKKLERANEYLAGARLLMEAELRAPAVDALWAAAELAVIAQMLMMEDRPIRDHQERRRWFTSWTRLGNAPSDHGYALADLASRRAAARYADRSLRVRDIHLDRLANQVADMIEYAKQMIADRPSR
jgi:hypothetical protein